MNMQEKINELSAVRAQIQSLRVRAQVLANSIREDVAKLDLGVESKPTSQPRVAREPYRYGETAKIRSWLNANGRTPFRASDVAKGASVTSEMAHRTLANMRLAEKIRRIETGLYVLVEVNAAAGEVVT